MLEGGNIIRALKNAISQPPPPSPTNGGKWILCEELECMMMQGMGGLDALGGQPVVNLGKNLQVDASTVS